MTELSSSTETIASEDQAIKERNKAKKKKKNNKKTGDSAQSPPPQPAQLVESSLASECEGEKPGTQMDKARRGLP